MGTALFRTKLFSGDGQTFLRKFEFRVPLAIRDGEGRLLSNWISSDGTGFAQVQRQVVAVNHTWVPSDTVTYWGNSTNGDVSVCAPTFGISVSDCHLFSPNGAPLRIVFSNGNYIYLTFEYNNYSQKYRFSHAYYCLERSSNPTTDYVYNYSFESGISASTVMTFPFPCPNMDGTVSDFHLRWVNYLFTQSPIRINLQYNLRVDWSSNLRAWVEGIMPADPDNPYDAGGDSEEGGGDPDAQNFEDISDDVEEDTMPTTSAVGTGFATLFTPTVSQLKNLADIMWGSQWWQALQNMVEGIDKMFVSLGIMPFVVTPGSTVEVSWLGMSITEVYLTLAAQQYFEFDMGTINLATDDRIWRSDSAMDYSPFSKLGIYLPFIGFQELNIDECRGKTIQLIYRIDALTGSCVALIKVGGNTIYQFTGNCMTQIPITSQSYDELFSTVTNVAIAGANVKTSQALAGGGDNVTAEAYTREKNPITETQGRYQVMQHAAMVSHAENGLASATANAITGLKPNYSMTGAVSASNSLMAVKQPYLFLTTPRQCIPQYYEHYAGFPANITDTLGNFEGFTVVNEIRLNGLVATAPEVEEIYDLLHSGVII